MTHSVLWVGPVVGDRVVGIVVSGCPCTGQSTVPLTYPASEKGAAASHLGQGLAQRAWASAPCPTVDATGRALLRLHQELCQLHLSWSDCRVL